MTTLETLAAIIDRIRPEGFEHATLHAELDKGWAKIDLRFKRESGDDLMSNLPEGSGLELHIELDKIRQEMAQTSGQRWESCQFELTADRQFRFDVTYPN